MHVGLLRGDRAARALARACVTLIALTGYAPSVAAIDAIVPEGFYDQLVMGSLDRPVGMAFLPDGRLIVIENDTGRVRLLVDGQLGAVDPMGTIAGLDSVGDEQGLMGIAVDPLWPARPYLYFHYAGSDTNLHIARYSAIGDLDQGTSGFLMLDPASKYEVLNGIPNVNPVHDGGTLRFGPDGMLYASFGEEGQPCTAVDTTLIRGVILRLDVSGLPDGPGGPPARTLIVPADNPWVGHPNVNARLAYVIGLRNPFRFHIDPTNGGLFVADVGQANVEEVNYFPGPGMDGGWPYLEGDKVFVTTQCGPPAPPILTPPIYTYDRATITVGAASVISGDVYHPVSCAGCNFPSDYNGDYFLSDFYEGFLRRLKFSGGTWALAPPVAGQPSPTDWGQGMRLVSDYVVGPDGALWYCRWAESYFIPNSGEIHRIYYQTNPASVGDRRIAGVSFDPPSPSPARGGAHFDYTLPRDMDVSLALYDLAGRSVRRLATGRKGPGTHAVSWDGRTERGDLAAPGVYVVRLTVDGASLVHRFPLIR